MKPKPRERITERENPASASLDTKPTREILRIINREDHRVAPAIRKTLPRSRARLTWQSKQCETADG